MAQFMLLLHEDPSQFADATPEEMQSIIGEYVAWRNQVESAGQLVGSNKLTDEGGKHLSLDDGRLRVVDGPYAEAKEVLGGYFIVEADDYEGAVTISRECPHLRYGGRIELREVHLMHEGDDG